MTSMARNFLIRFLDKMVIDTKWLMSAYDMPSEQLYALRDCVNIFFNLSKYYKNYYADGSDHNCST